MKYTQKKKNSEPKKFGIEILRQNFSSLEVARVCLAVLIHNLLVFHKLLPKDFSKNIVVPLFKNVLSEHFTLKFC